MDIDQDWISSLESALPRIPVGISQIGSGDSCYFVASVGRYSQAQGYQIIEFSQSSDSNLQVLHIFTRDDEKMKPSRRDVSHVGIYYKSIINIKTNEEIQYDILVSNGEKTCFAFRSGVEIGNTSCESDPGLLSDRWDVHPPPVILGGG